MAFPFFCLIGVYIVVVHNVRFMVDKGIAPMTAAFVFAMAGMSSAIFRIFWGWISDHIGREKAYTLGMGSIFLGVFSLLLMDAVENRLFMYTFFIFFGMGWELQPPFHGDCCRSFQRKDLWSYLRDRRRDHGFWRSHRLLDCRVYLRPNQELPHGFCPGHHRVLSVLHLYLDRRSEESKEEGDE